MESHAGEVKDATHGGGRTSDLERPAVALCREVGVHQRRQPGGVHERDLGKIERDRVPLAAEAVQHLVQFGRGGDVQLTVQNQQAIAAEVGDLRDLPARGT